MVNTNNNIINKFIRDVTSVAKFPMAKSETRRRLNEIIYEVLEDYTTFLCKNSYADSDVYAEEPKAVDRFLEEVSKLKK